MRGWSKYRNSHNIGELEVSGRETMGFIRVKLLVSTLETKSSEVQNKVFKDAEQSVSSSGTLCILRCYETFWLCLKQSVTMPKNKVLVAK